MGLDRRGGLAGERCRAFDHIWIQRALHQKLDVAKFAGLFLENRDKFVADPPPLDFRVLDTGELAEEPFAGVHVNHVHAELIAKYAHHTGGLVLAEQSVVDEDRHEPRANRPMNQRRGDRRVDPAAQSAHRQAVTGQFADLPTAELISDAVVH